MNACIRAVVRTALHEGLQVAASIAATKALLMGIFGEIESPFGQQHHPARGNHPALGTLLRIPNPEGRQKAYENLVNLE